ncbi:MAG: glutaredoxin 3 [Candidatus Poribacteria bacterium]|nr:MAG: glutaredoxin 3 [Candidatus Poribacteria bacterium]
MAKPRVRIYTLTGCPYCARALAILREHGVPYEEINITGREQLRDEIERLCGRRDVPQVFVDGRHIGDDEALAEWAAAGKLEALRG